MARDQIETNSGMIANAPAMRKFVQDLKELVNELTDKMNAARKHIDEVEKLGYTDSTFQDFHQKFEDEIKFINAINKFLEENGQHYTKLAEIVDEHNNLIKKAAAR